MVYPDRDTLTNFFFNNSSFFINVYFTSQIWKCKRYSVAAVGKRNASFGTKYKRCISVALCSCQRMHWLRKITCSINDPTQVFIDFIMNYNNKLQFRCFNYHSFIFFIYLSIFLIIFRRWHRLTCTSESKTKIFRKFE